MVAIKFFGLIVTFYLVVVLEAFGQNFYPARYGKRDENESRGEKNLPEWKRVGKSGSPEMQDRKIGFFISGGRFGKRGCTTDNCFEGSKEVVSSGYQNRQDRSDRIRLPIRKNQFMVGSRFGKRAEGTDSNGLDLRCVYTGISEFFRCSERSERGGESEGIDFTSNGEFFQ